MRTAQVKKSAKEFVDQYMGANDVAAVVHTSGRTDAAQEFTSNKALLHAAIDKFVGRRMRSLTIERLDSYYQSLLDAPNDQPSRAATASRRHRPIRAGYSRMEPTDIRARISRRRRARHAEEHRGVSRIGARPPQGGPVLQRRHRLPHHRFVRRPQRDRRHSRHAGCHHDGRARERELLHDRSARPGRHDERVHGDGGRRLARSWPAGRRCARRARTRR